MRFLLAALVGISHAQKISAPPTEVKASVDVRANLIAVCPEVSARCGVPSGPIAAPDKLSAALECMLKVDLSRIPRGSCYDTMKVFLANHAVAVPDGGPARQAPYVQVSPDMMSHMRNYPTPNGFSLWTRDPAMMRGPMQRPPMVNSQSMFLGMKPGFHVPNREGEPSRWSRSDNDDDDDNRRTRWEATQPESDTNPWDREDKDNKFSKPWGREDRDSKHSKPWDREAPLNHEDRDSKHSKPWDREDKDSKFSKPWDREDRDSKHSKPWDREDKDSKHSKPWDREDRDSKHSKHWNREDKDSKHSKPWDREDSKDCEHSKPWDREDRNSKHSKSWDREDMDRKSWDREDKDSKHSKPWDREEMDDSRDKFDRDMPYSMWHNEERSFPFYKRDFEHSDRSKFSISARWHADENTGRGNEERRRPSVPFMWNHGDVQRPSFPWNRDSRVTFPFPNWQIDRRPSYSNNQARPPPFTPNMLPPQFQAIMQAKLARSSSSSDVRPTITPSLAPIIQAIMASRARSSQSQSAQPRIEIAFKGPAIVATPEIATEVSPPVETQTSNEQEKTIDEISYRSAP